MIRVNWPIVPKQIWKGYGVLKDVLEKYSFCTFMIFALANCGLLRGRKSPLHLQEQGHPFAGGIVALDVRIHRYSKCSGVMRRMRNCCGGVSDSGKRVGCVLLCDGAFNSSIINGTTIAPEAFFMIVEQCSLRGRRRRYAVVVVECVPLPPR